MLTAKRRRERRGGDDGALRFSIFQLMFHVIQFHVSCPAMGFEITTTHTFSAAPAIVLYDGTLEPVHGHNWRASVTVASDKLDSVGVVMDFHLLQRLVDEVIRPMHNRPLNELPAFA
jgi:hypothetical protein